MDIKTERIEISVGGATMGAYVARPDDDEQRPAVLVFMEIFGINSHIREVTERIAREGYVALFGDDAPAKPPARARRAKRAPAKPGS